MSDENVSETWKALAKKAFPLETCDKCCKPCQPNEIFDCGDDWDQYRMCNDCCPTLRAADLALVAVKPVGIQPELFSVSLVGSQPNR